MMTSETMVDLKAELLPGQAALLGRLQDFALDQSDTALTFSQRLAREQGWTIDYALRVIQEYKKFAFLAVVAEHPVTPSDQVDQVWHLHLSYTRSYWDIFCPTVLETPLHHEPNQGGDNENQKFKEWYASTLDRYEYFFGEAPPQDIWPNPDARFAQGQQFVRVNTQENWVVPKLLGQRIRFATISAAFALLLGYFYATYFEGANLISVGIFTLLCTGFGFGILENTFNITRKNTGEMTWADTGACGFDSGGGYG